MHIGVGQRTCTKSRLYPARAYTTLVVLVVVVAAAVVVYIAAFVVVDPRNLSVKFGQNWVSYI